MLGDYPCTHWRVTFSSPKHRSNKYKITRLKIINQVIFNVIKGRMPARLIPTYRTYIQNNHDMRSSNNRVGVRTCISVARNQNSLGADIV